MYKKFFNVKDNIKPGRGRINFVQAKRYNNIKPKREVEDLATILISVNYASEKKKEKGRL